MDRDVLEFAQVMAVLVPSLLVLMGGVVTSFWFIRRSLRQPQPPPTLDRQDSERLERLEHAIDAMAVEIERISEGQRFTTKLLAERSKAEELR